MMIIPQHLKEPSKVIGYFSYTGSGNVFCDADACVIAGSSEAIKTYLEKVAASGNERDIIRKTRFSEIIEGLRRGGAYAFDEEAYARFARHAKNNGIDGLPPNNEFSGSSAGMHFIRLQMLG